jgi:general secretion pathway protein I
MRGSQQKGFSLLEVLVAFAILSVSLGVLLQVFATGLRNATLSEEYTLATLHAESLLARIGTEIPLSEGMQEGQLDEIYAWRSTVVPYFDEGIDPEATDILTYQVRIEVFWRGTSQARSVMLETLRLAPLSLNSPQ